MARGIRIGFNQGPRGAFLSTGKFGILTPSASFSNTSTGPPPPSNRLMPAGGQFVTLSVGQSGTGGRTTGGSFVGIPGAGPVKFIGGVPSPGKPGTGLRTDGGPIAPNVCAVYIRHNFKNIDNDDGTWNLDQIAWYLAQASTFTGQLLVYVMPIVRTFPDNAGNDGPDPAPASLSHTAATPHTYRFKSSVTAGFGYQMGIWEDIVQDRIEAMAKAIGGAFDGHPNFGGVCTQETANGGVTAGGFSFDTILHGLNRQAFSIGTYCPHGRHLNFINFGGGNLNNSESIDMLTQHVAYGRQFGMLLTCPDLTPTNHQVNTVTYEVLKRYAEGTHNVPTPGWTSASMQAGEYAGDHAAAGDKPISFGNIFNFATRSKAYAPGDFSPSDPHVLDWSPGNAAGRVSPINIKGIIWNWKEGSGTVANPAFNPQASRIIHDHSNFGPIIGPP